MELDAKTDIETMVLEVLDSAEMGLKSQIH